VTRGLCLLVALLGLGALPSISQAQGSGREPRPNTPIEHFMVLMQENHSFDNYFGTYPGANGLPKDVCMPVAPNGPAPRRLLRPGGVGALSTPRGSEIYDTRSGKPCVRPFRLGDRSIDLPHTIDAHARQYAGGRMNGFIDAVAKEGLGPDPAAMGYYDRRDLPYHWKIADRYVLFDRFFQSAHSGSVPNHMYWVTGTVGNRDGHHHLLRQGFRDIPTIFDRLEAAGISWKFYVQDYDPRENYRTNITSDQVHWVPLLNFPRFIDSPRLSRRIVDLDEYFEDLNNGTLPAVAFMVPKGASEHPPGSLREGQRFVSTLVNSLMQSRFWDSSAFMWSYDDWGGFYDHVRPPRVDSFGYGFRVPALLVSPYARRGHIDSTTLDFTSILKFIERNWDLRPLASRDARARSIAGAFDFARPPREPEIVSATPRPERRPETNRVVIYGAYGTALGLALVVIILQLLSSARAAARRAQP
jgi:phospholipase C